MLMQTRWNSKTGRTNMDLPQASFAFLHLHIYIYISTFITFLHLCIHIYISAVTNTQLQG
jgi:hypothetical protein